MSSYIKTSAKFPMAARELNGDARLTSLDRLRYLATNLCRNLRRGGVRIAIWRWAMPPSIPVAREAFAASPLRILSETFLRAELPRIIPRRTVNVLDVGCGSGRLAALLADARFSGRYTGVDVTDRFIAKAPGGGAFAISFIAGDAHTASLGGPFDLILSVSALEHIVDDKALLARLDGLLAGDGMQVHIVPAPAALPLYLWHGYRQYGAASLSDRFEKGARVFALGGVASWLVHFLWITIPEVLLRVKLRRRFAEAYEAAVRVAFRLDRYLPRCALGYAIVSPPTPRANRNATP